MFVLKLDEMTLQAYVLQEKGDLLSLVDPILGSEYAAKEAKMILELAMLCTNPSPTL